MASRRSLAARRDAACDAWRVARRRHRPSRAAAAAARDATLALLRAELRAARAAAKPRPARPDLFEERI
ncbi:MAG TPA: hypothetical protein VM434_12945 [Beijerinckiaceae bacterium]|nr:hypothetical protein [Beijerinckiaceae bacterium]